MGTVHQAGGTRRVVRFASIDDLLIDLDRLVAAERAGRLRLAGQWSFGQILNHMTAWVGYAYDGFPLKLPWVVRFFLKFRKKAFLYAPMRAGLRIPSVPGGTLATEDVPLDRALPAFRVACERLRRTPPTRPHPFLGPLTHDEWIALHLRHAELHLSFATDTATAPQPPR